MSNRDRMPFWSRSAIPPPRKRRNSGYHADVISLLARLPPTPRGDCLPDSKKRALGFSLSVCLSVTDDNRDGQKQPHSFELTD